MGVWMVHHSMMGLQTTRGRLTWRVWDWTPQSPLSISQTLFLLSPKPQNPIADSNWLKPCMPASLPCLSRFAKPWCHTKELTPFHTVTSTGLQVGARDSDHFNKSIIWAQATRKQWPEDYLTRGVKNTDKLENMFAVVRDNREVITSHARGMPDLQFTWDV